MNYEFKRAGLVKLDWNKLMEEDALITYGKTDTLLNEVVLPRDAIMCTDVNCNEISHCTVFLCYVILWEQCIRLVDHILYTDKKYNNKPGWKKECLYIILK